MVKKEPNFPKVVKLRKICAKNKNRQTGKKFSEKERAEKQI